MRYEKEFSIFSSNIKLAANSFEYYKTLLSDYKNNKKVQEASNSHQNFWKNFEYSSFLVVIVTLGRIFDKDKESHSIYKLLNAIKNTDHFKKSSLKARLNATKHNCEGEIDSLIERSYELNDDDISELKKSVDEAEKLWNGMRNIRNKILGHDDAETRSQIDDILTNIILGSDDNETNSKKVEIIGTYNPDSMNKLISILLTIEHILNQSILNPTKPNCAINTQWNIIEEAKNNMKSILSTLYDDRLNGN